VRMINTLFVISVHLLLFELYFKETEINKVNLYVLLIHFDISSFIKLDKTKFTIWYYWRPLIILFIHFLVNQSNEMKLNLKIFNLTNLKAKLSSIKNSAYSLCCNVNFECTYLVTAKDVLNLNLMINHCKEKIILSGVSP